MPADPLPLPVRISADEAKARQMAEQPPAQPDDFPTVEQVIADAYENADDFPAVDEEPFGHLGCFDEKLRYVPE